MGSRCVSAAAPAKLLRSRVFPPGPAARLFLPSRARPSREPHRSLAVVPSIRNRGYYGECPVSLPRVSVAATSCLAYAIEAPLMCLNIGHFSPAQPEMPSCTPPAALPAMGWRCGRAWASSKAGVSSAHSKRFAQFGYEKLQDVAGARLGVGARPAEQVAEFNEEKPRVGARTGSRQASAQ